MDPLPPGELAAVVTFLEMDSRPRSDVPQCELKLQRLAAPSVEHYRSLFRLVGGRWLWFSRLAMDDGQLASIVQHPKVEIHSVIDEGGGEAGMIELDFREAGQCELAFIGLVPELAGKGHGRWLLAEALRLAWRDGVSRVHVHTCSLDHPAALRAYIGAGFRPYKRAVERFRDPRLTGVLPPDCAPQVPLLGTLTRSTSSPTS